MMAFVSEFWAFIAELQKIPFKFCPA